MREFNPVLISSKGWLTAQCEAHDIAYLETAFPRSRSLTGKLFLNRTFTSATARKLSKTGPIPGIVHANDHLEGILGLKLAKEFQAKSVIFLRSPGMTRDDYFKYRCGEYDLIIAVGDELQQRSQAWDSNREIQLIPDGVYASEFSSPKTRTSEFPNKLLVIGSPADWKGWADLTEALFLLEQEQSLFDLEVHFTGIKPDPSKNDLKLGRHSRAKFKFLGRVERFRELLLGYDLVVNASRQESFGMAAIEVLAAGVPLLSSRTGVIEQVVTSDQLLFLPADPADLSAKLRWLMENWDGVRSNLPEYQKNIRQKFNIDDSVEKLVAQYRDLLSV